MKLEINTTLLSRDEEALQLQLENLKKDMNELTASIESLDQTWEGTAREVYMAQYQSDKNSMENMCRTLEEFIRLLDYAKTQYQDCDNKVKELISQLRI